MSSPFQKAFSAKSPISKALIGNQENLPDHLKDKIKNAPENPEAGDRDYEGMGNRFEANNPETGDKDYEGLGNAAEAAESTTKKKSPLNSSPLNGAYSSGADGMVTVSDAGYFSKLQRDILGSTKQYIEDTKGENQIKQANKRKRRFEDGKGSWAKQQLDKLGLGVLTADYTTNSDGEGKTDYEEKTERMMNRGRANAKGGGKGMGKNMQCQPGYTWDGTKCI